MFLNTFKLLGVKLISFLRCQCLHKKEHHILCDAIIQNVWMDVFPDKLGYISIALTFF